MNHSSTKRVFLGVCFTALSFGMSTELDALYNSDTERAAQLAAAYTAGPAVTQATGKMVQDVQRIFSGNASSPADYVTRLGNVLNEILTKDGTEQGSLSSLDALKSFLEASPDILPALNAAATVVQSNDPAFQNISDSLTVLNNLIEGTPNLALGVTTEDSLRAVKNLIDTHAGDVVAAITNTSTILAGRVPDENKSILDMATAIRDKMNPEQGSGHVELLVNRHLQLLSGDENGNTLASIEATIGALNETIDALPLDAGGTHLPSIRAKLDDVLQKLGGNAEAALFLEGVNRIGAELVLAGYSGQPTVGLSATEVRDLTAALSSYPSNDVVNLLGTVNVYLGYLRPVGTISDVPTPADLTALGDLLHGLASVNVQTVRSSIENLSGYFSGDITVQTPLLAQAQSLSTLLEGNPFIGQLNVSVQDAIKNLVGPVSAGIGQILHAASLRDAVDQVKGVVGNPGTGFQAQDIKGQIQEATKSMTGPNALNDGNLDLTLESALHTLDGALGAVDDPAIPVNPVNHLLSKINRLIDQTGGVLGTHTLAQRVHALQTDLVDAQSGGASGILTTSQLADLKDILKEVSAAPITDVQDLMAELYTLAGRISYPYDPSNKDDTNITTQVKGLSAFIDGNYDNGVFESVAKVSRNLDGTINPEGTVDMNTRLEDLIDTLMDRDLLMVPEPDPFNPGQTRNVGPTLKYALETISANIDGTTQLSTASTLLDRLQDVLEDTTFFPNGSPAHLIGGLNELQARLELAQASAGGSGSGSGTSMLSVQDQQDLKHILGVATQIADVDALKNELAQFINTRVGTYTYDPTNASTSLKDQMDGLIGSVAGNVNDDLDHAIWTLVYKLMQASPHDGPEEGVGLGVMGSIAHKIDSQLIGLLGTDDTDPTKPKKITIPDPDNPGSTLDMAASLRGALIELARNIDGNTTVDENDPILGRIQSMTSALGQEGNAGGDLFAKITSLQTTKNANNAVLNLTNERLNGASGDTLAFINNIASAIDGNTPTVDQTNNILFKLNGVLTDIDTRITGANGASTATDIKGKIAELQTALENAQSGGEGTLTDTQKTELTNILGLATQIADVDAIVAYLGDARTRVKNGAADLNIALNDVGTALDGSAADVLSTLDHKISTARSATGETGSNLNAEITTLKGKYDQAEIDKTAAQTARQTAEDDRDVALGSLEAVSGLIDGDNSNNALFALAIAAGKIDGSLSVNVTNNILARLNTVLNSTGLNPVPADLQTAIDDLKSQLSSGGSGSGSGGEGTLTDTQKTELTNILGLTAQIADVEELKTALTNDVIESKVGAYAYDSSNLDTTLGEQLKLMSRVIAGNDSLPIWSALQGFLQPRLDPAIALGSNGNNVTGSIRTQLKNMVGADNTNPANPKTVTIADPQNPGSTIQDDDPSLKSVIQALARKIDGNTPTVDEANNLLGKIQAVQNATGTSLGDNLIANITFISKYLVGQDTDLLSSVLSILNKLKLNTSVSSTDNIQQHIENQLKRIKGADVTNDTLESLIEDLSTKIDGNTPTVDEANNVLGKLDAVISDIDAGITGANGASTATDIKGKIAELQTALASNPNGGDTLTADQQTALQNVLSSSIGSIPTAASVVTHIENEFQRIDPNASFLDNAIDEVGSVLDGAATTNVNNLRQKVTDIGSATEESGSHLMDQVVALKDKKDQAVSGKAAAESARDTALSDLATAEQQIATTSGQLDGDETNGVLASLSAVAGKIDASLTLTTANNLLNHLNNVILANTGLSNVPADVKTAIDDLKDELAAAQLGNGGSGDISITNAQFDALKAVVDAAGNFADIDAVTNALSTDRNRIKNGVADLKVALNEVGTALDGSAADVLSTLDHKISTARSATGETGNNLNVEITTLKGKYDQAKFERELATNALAGVMDEKTRVKTNAVSLADAINATGELVDGSVPTDTETVVKKINDQLAHAVGRDSNTGDVNDILVPDPNDPATTIPEAATVKGLVEGVAGLIDGDRAPTDNNNVFFKLEDLALKIDNNTPSIDDTNNLLSKIQAAITAASGDPATETLSVAIQNLQNDLATAEQNGGGSGTLDGTQLTAFQNILDAATNFADVDAIVAHLGDARARVKNGVDLKTAINEVGQELDGSAPTTVNPLSDRILALASKIDGNDPEVGTTNNLMKKIRDAIVLASGDPETELLSVAIQNLQDDLATAEQNGGGSGTLNSTQLTQFQQILDNAAAFADVSEVLGKVEDQLKLIGGEDGSGFANAADIQAGLTDVADKIDPVTGLSIANSLSAQLQTQIGHMAAVKLDENGQPVEGPGSEPANPVYEAAEDVAGSLKFFGLMVDGAPVDSASTLHAKLDALGNTLNGVFYDPTGPDVSNLSEKATASLRAIGGVDGSNVPVVSNIEQGLMNLGQALFNGIPNATDNLIAKVNSTVTAAAAATGHAALPRDLDTEVQDLIANQGGGGGAATTTELQNISAMISEGQSSATAGDLTTELDAVLSKVGAPYVQGDSSTVLNSQITTETARLGGVDINSNNNYASLTEAVGALGLYADGTGPEDVTASNSLVTKFHNQVYRLSNFISVKDAADNLASMVGVAPGDVTTGVTLDTHLADAIAKLNAGSPSVAHATGEVIEQLVGIDGITFDPAAPDVGTALREVKIDIGGFAPDGVAPKAHDVPGALAIAGDKIASSDLATEGNLADQLNTQLIHMVGEHETFAGEPRQYDDLADPANSPKDMSIQFALTDLGNRLLGTTVDATTPLEEHIRQIQEKVTSVEFDGSSTANIALTNLDSAVTVAKGHIDSTALNIYTAVDAQLKNMTGSTSDGNGGTKPLPVVDPNTAEAVEATVANVVQDLGFRLQGEEVDPITNVTDMIAQVQAKATGVEFNVVNKDTTNLFVALSEAKNSLDDTINGSSEENSANIAEAVTAIAAQVNPNNDPADGGLSVRAELDAQLAAFRAMIMQIKANDPGDTVLGPITQAQVDAETSLQGLIQLVTGQEIQS